MSTFDGFAGLISFTRLATVTAAHELRRDYERGVFSRQTLAVIGGCLALAPVLVYGGSPSLAIGTVGVAAWMTYTVARTDRHWRDETKHDP